MPPVRNRIFLSYSHRDKHWLEEFLLMLNPMLRYQVDVQTWSDAHIEPGEIWKAKIDEALLHSRIAILLVSKHFLNSEFIREHELPAILAMRDDGLEVLWVLIGNCPWEESELFHIQALHDTSKPLDSLTETNRDLAIKCACASIRHKVRPTSTAPRKTVAASPTPAPAPPPANELLLSNLLYATTAINMGFITSQRFTEVCVLWSATPTKEIRDFLREHDIDDLGNAEIERVVDRLLARHAGNISATLSAATDSTLRQAARQSNVPEIVGSMDGLSDDGGEVIVLPTLSARYERGELHARGKLGQIWSARDIALNREVALKVVAEQSRDSEAARQRLLREARIGGRLEHPFIVPVYDVAEGDDGAPFYSMRMLRGPTLADQIARHHRERSSGRLDPLERRRLLDNFKDVCLAVAYAHKQGVLHLDLKPQNVVLGEYGEVYLLDWGLSREVPILGESTSNGSGTTKFTAEAPNTSNPEGRFGTPAYMSPEQAAGRPDRCDERTDVWGLGAILYELLTGKPPHSDEGIQDNSFFERIQTEPRRLPAEIGGGSLNPLSQLCMSALSIDPTMRIPSAEDMAMAVERWIDEEPMQPYRANIVTFESRLTEDPDHPAVNEGLARELFVLALVEGGLCRFSAACLTMARAESIYQGLCERFPADRRLRSALAISRMHFARLMERAGESERAEAMKRKLDSEIESLQQEALADDDRELSIVMTYFGLPIKPAEKPTSQERSKTDAADHTPSPLPPAQTVNIPDSILTGSPTSRFDKVRSISPHDIPLARDSVSDIVSPVTIVGPISPPGSSRVLPENDFLAREYYGGRFRAIKLIGTGGSSEVFLAHDGECQRHVAIKRLRRGIENDRLVRMLVEEGKIVAGLAHPGIPAVYSLGFDSEGAPFYAMSYCAGRDLAHLLSSQGPRSPTGTSVEKSQWVNWYNSGIKDALRVLIRACATIEHAHRNGVIHRDIKPSNIMWDRKSDQVVVIDWGLALLRDDSSPYGEHNSGDIIGTLGYMSPEQAKGCIDGIDPRSDIYSVGVILYETLAIRRPILFSHSSKILELLRLVIEGTYDPLNQTAPYAPPALRHICERAMQLSPERRYSSIADFARDIENWLEGRPVSVYREGLWRRAVRWATSWRCR